MAKLVINDVTSGFHSTAALNAAFTAIETAIENTVSRDGSSPNQLTSNLDLNGRLILNQANPISVTGFRWEGPWLTGQTYSIGDTIFSGLTGSAYICIIAHTAGDFATDLAALKWQVIAEASLPTQTGNAAKFLQTNGTIASWQVPNSSEVSFTQTGTGAVLRNVLTKIRESISVLDFGAVGDGITDDTVAVQKALDAGISIYIPANYTVNVTSVVITKKGTELHGPGSFKGSLSIAMPQVGDPFVSIIAAVKIIGVKFINSTEPIILRRGRGILITNNTFDTITSSCIVIRPTVADFDSSNHCVEDVNINGNICSMVDRLLLIDTSVIAALLVTNWWLGNGDIHVINNIVRVGKICHIQADRVDGLSILNNTFLHFGSASAITTKTYCIYVSIKGAQLLIQGNELFEAGLAAIKLNECQNYNIHSNNIIDSGQVVPSSAIEITYTPSGGLVTLGADGLIHGNSINGSTNHGIYIKDNSKIGVSNNKITLNSSPVYYGVPVLPTFTSRYGVFTEQTGTSTNVFFKDNFTVDAPTRTFNPTTTVILTSAGNVRYDESTTTTTLNGNYEQINLIQSAPTTITTITNGYEAKTVRLITFNGNTTIQNNATIKTGTGADKLLTTDSIYTLTKYGSIWYLK